MGKRAKCGICNKYVSIKIVDKKNEEVIFVCKEHGQVTQYVEWSK